MNQEELILLSEQTHADGQNLLKICRFLFDGGIYANWFIGIIGLIGGFIVSQRISFLWGASIWIFTVVFCFFIFIALVLATHYGIVMVHTSFSNLAIIQHLNSDKLKKYEYRSWGDRS